MFDNRNPWNVQYNARSNRSHPPTSPNIAPAPKNESNACSSLRMKRHLYCAGQQGLPSNITKYCSCHENLISWLILETHATSFTLRGATKITLQHHQILHLPRKESSRTQLKRHLQCGNDPRMIQEWSEQATRLATEVAFRAHHEHFLLKNTTFRAPAIIPNFTKCCTCHEKWQLNFTKYCGCHEKWHHQILHVPRKVTVELHQIMHLPRKVTLELHQIVHLPRKVTLEPLLFFDSTSLFSTIPCYSIEVLLDWTITWLN